MLRGWLERVFVPGVAFDFDDNGKLRPGLTHIRRIIGISTYGSPWTLRQDRQRQRPADAHCGRCASTAGGARSTTWLGLYSIDTTGDNERRAFLDRVEHTMANVK